MQLRRNSLFTLAAAALLAVALAACGGSDDSNSDNSAGGTATGGGGGQTVATQSISGVGDALVDSSGKVLYTNDMDTGSKIACTDECLTEWVPLAAPGSGQPTSDDSAVQSKLGTTKRPDGSTQVTFGGMPIYTFVEDGPGQATGNGFTDSFGGTEFLWTAATVSGEAAPSSTTTGGSTSGGSGGAYGGGY
jgi:predicted lipoprotein with Yx(FWY)xxD motif